jgi:hypothetical protein
MQEDSNSYVLSERGEDGQVQHTCNRVCYNCWGQHYFTCETCGVTVPRGTEAIVNGHQINCQHCAEGMEECDGCHTRFSASRNLREHEGHSYCRSCRPSLYDPSIIIQNYSSREAAIMTPLGKGPIWYGVELELEVKDYPSTREEPFLDEDGEFYSDDEDEDSDSDRMLTARRIKPYIENFAIMKSDGSLSNGIEIVSCRADLENHQKMWDDFFRHKPRNIRSYDTRTCGMHIHVSREPLTQLQMGKMLVFVNEPNNKQLMVKVARRDSCHYTKFIKKNYRQAKTDLERTSPDRYQAINMQNSHTMEFRMFRGTLNRESFISNIEFVASLVEYTAPCNSFFAKKRYSIKDAMKAETYLEFLAFNRKKYPLIAKRLLDTQ